MKEKELILEFYNTQEKNCKNAVDTLLLQIFKSIDLYYWHNKNKWTSPEQIALDKRENETKGYFIGIWEKFAEWKIKNENDLIGAIRSKYGMRIWKQNLWNQIQRQAKNEYDTLKKWADESWEEVGVLDLCVSHIPTPFEKVNKDYEKKVLYEMWIQADIYLEYIEWKIDISRQKAHDIKMKIKWKLRKDGSRNI